MMRVGLTGGIGSGKTAVSDYFQRLGIPVLDTDVIARQVVEPGSEVLHQICQTFGNDLLNHKGELQREKLRALVFADADRRQRLENIIHPAIRRQLQDQLVRLADSTTADYCIIVIPLLVEKNWQSQVDRILLVRADENLRGQRVKQRQSISQREIEQIMHSQTSDSERASVADDILINDGTLDELHQQIDHLHQRYLGLARHVRD